MNTLTLSSASRSALAGQAAQNGTFYHGLRDARGLIRCMAFVIIEQCDAATHVRVELGDSVNSLTLARRADTGERIVHFLEELANGVSPSGVPEVDEYQLVGDLELTLRDAVRVGRGTYYLPVDDIDLCLLLWLAQSNTRRTTFRFELNGEGLTLPLLLPSDRQIAYELLSACVQELIANYRSSAA
jgi:hypothetical protein